MIKIFCCKSTRSCRLRFLHWFTAGFVVVEAGGAGGHPTAASDSGGDAVMLIQISAAKTFAIVKFI